MTHFRFRPSVPRRPLGRKALRLGIMILASGALVGGCSNSPRTYFMGQWVGGFEANSTKSPFSLAQHRLKGFLQLYGTKESFLLHLEGPQQTLDLTGTWEHKPKPERVILSVADIKIDDFGGEDKRDPNRPYLSEDKLRDTFRTPVSLRLSTDRLTLESLELPIEVTTFVGKFKRQGSGR